MDLRRYLAPAFLGLGVVLWSGSGHAQTTTTTPQDLAKSDFTIKLRQPDGKGGWAELAKADQELYFNQARCRCDADTDTHENEVNILVQMESASRSKLTSSISTGANARLYVGTDCASLNANKQPSCPNGLLASLSGLSKFTSDGSWDVTVKVNKLFAGIGTCDQTVNTTIWLWLDSKGNQYPDASIQGSNAPSLGIKLDGTPPPTPSGVVVEGGNESLKVSWNDMTKDNPDLAGYVVFCMRGEGLQVFNPSYWDGQYMTARTLCGTGTVTGGSSTTSSLKGDTTAIEVPAPAPFKTLDPNYMCSGRLSINDKSTRIRVLQNGIPYTVGVAAVDLSGNISPITNAFVQKPVPTVDFYRAYRDAGGQAQGGYCSLGGGSAYLGAWAWLASAGLMGALIARRRRRRRSSIARDLTVLLAILCTSAAQAQSEAITHEDLDASFEEPQPSYRSPQNFAFELRFGPYRPNIDSEFSDTGVTPHKDVFGDKRHLMMQFELDWQIFQSFGSLSLGAVVGSYSQSAKAFVADSNTGASTGERSGDDTSLRLIPLAALLVYRFDVLAVHFRAIPLAPYGKIGLNYTFWRITDGNGNIPSHLGGRGSGGTLGWQAAAGVALMLDFLDPIAVRSLDVETGVNHTYVFFEWNHVEANGLGMSNKLHVGDSRWVLGLMFEF